MNRRRLGRVGMVGLSGLCSLLLLARCVRNDAPAAVGTRVPENKVAATKAPEPKPGDWTVFASKVQPFFAKNCIACHGAEMPEAGIRLDNFVDADAVDKRAHVLTHALTMLRKRKMPPSDQTQPTTEELKPVIAWLDSFATKVEAADVKDPGHVTMRRLNRAEYNNTIHDLLGVEFKPADGFPVDDAGYGFDNNGDVLTLPPLLMDKYLTAAEMALDHAINVAPIAPPPVKRWDAAVDWEGTVPKGTATPAIAGTQNAGQNNPKGRVFEYNGEIWVDYDFPVTGSYSLRIKAYGTPGAVPPGAGGPGGQGRGPQQAAAPQGAARGAAPQAAAAQAAPAPGAAAVGQAATPQPPAPQGAVPQGAVAQGAAPQGAPAPGAPAQAVPGRGAVPQAAQAQAQAGAGRGRGPQPARPTPQFKIDGQLVDKPITVAADLRGQLFYSTSAPVHVSAGHHVLGLSFFNGPTKEELAAALAAAPKLAAADPAADPANPAPANFAGRGRGGNRGNVPADPNAAAVPAVVNGKAAQPAANNSAAPAAPAVLANATPAPAAGNNLNNAVADAGAAAAPPAVGRGAPPAGAPPVPGRGNLPPGAAAAQGRGRGFQIPQPQNSPTGKPTLGVVFIEAEGPLENSIDRMPESFKKVFVTLPGDTVTKEQAAREIITRFATRAYRRPVKSTELERLMAYWSEIDASGEPFEKGIMAALQPVLASPHFLYRVEGDPTPSDPGGIRTLNEYELASRLSYFIWSSMPDDELITLAGKGQLRANLDSQVRRMLASPKSYALCENFAGQWLQLRKVANVLPDSKKYPDFDESLRSAMLKETQLFFSAIVTEDRSVLDFIDANFTFMNERLAKHYGIKDVTGDDFRRVALTGNQRGGILTQASIMTITSFPSRTSPVIRGKWVLENLLDEAPPPPPPNVPKLEEGATIDAKATLRERMEAHRTNPNCISCHSAMDPIGFGLENYDAIGAWRDRDLNNEVIDATGKLPDGQSFDGPAGLKKILIDQKDQFCECLVNRMMTYALGRGMEQSDLPKVRHIAEGMKAQNYKFSSMILQIVESDPFQKQGPKRGEE